MSSPNPTPFRPPRWLLLLVSAALSAHLFIVLMNALAVDSGPWPGENGPERRNAPHFAYVMHERTNAGYLRALRMHYKGRFASNMPTEPAVQFEVSLKDASGKVVKELKFPDPDANAWIRHHQNLLARGILDDEPVTIEGEKIAAPGRQPPKTLIWDTAPSTKPGSNELQLREETTHLLASRERPPLRPSTWSLILARSYARHLCKTYGAESATIVRTSRRAIPASALSDDDLPGDFFTSIVVNFGEVKP